KQGRGSAGMGPCTSAGGESRLGRGAGQAAAQEVKGYRQQKKYHRPYGQEEARVGPADEEYATQVARGHYEPHPGGAAVGGRGQREHAAGQQQPPEPRGAHVAQRGLFGVGGAGPLEKVGMGLKRFDELRHLVGASVVGSVAQTSDNKRAFRTG